MFRKVLTVRTSLRVASDLLLLPGILWSSIGNCHADVFHFKDGRVISGTVVKEQETTKDGLPVKIWTVQIESNPKVYMLIHDKELDRNGREELNDAELEYLQRVKSVPDDAQAHYEFAGWCSGKFLRDLQQAHYRRAIDIEPNHNQARSGAEYRKDENGRWVKVAEEMQQRRGKIYYGGRWRFPESVLIEEAEETQKKQTGAVNKQVWAWHRDAVMSTGVRHSQALENLQQLNDPLAIGILTELLMDTRKPTLNVPTPRELKLLYIRLLSQFDNYVAVSALAQASILLADPQLRNAALDSLANKGREAAIPVFVSYLRNPNNDLVNIAGDALGRLRAEETILPLIEAVTTKHTIVQGDGSTTYGADGGMSLAGNPRSKEIDVPNSSVRATLAQLTGQNFGFDKAQWLAWYASIHAAPAGDLRRDY